MLFLIKISKMILLPLSIGFLHLIISILCKLPRSSNVVFLQHPDGPVSNKILSWKIKDNYKQQQQKLKRFCFAERVAELLINKEKSMWFSSAWCK